MSLVTFFTHDGLLAVLKHTGQEITARLPGGAVISAFRSPGRLASAIWDVAATPAIFIFVGRLAWIGIAVAFFFGAFRYLKAEDPTAVAVSVLFLVGYFATTTVVNGFGVHARFRMPVNVFIFTFALHGILGNSKFGLRNSK
jgi:hypothetical protein